MSQIGLKRPMIRKERQKFAKNVKEIRKTPKIRLKRQKIRENVENSL